MPSLMAYSHISTQYFVRLENMKIVAHLIYIFFWLTDLIAAVSLILLVEYGSQFNLLPWLWAVLISYFLGLTLLIIRVVNKVQSRDDGFLISAFIATFPALIALVVLFG